VHFLLRDYDQSIAEVEQTPALDAMRAGLKVHPHMPGVEAFAEELRKRVEGEDI
jgi:hypothetical protein